MLPGLLRGHYTKDMKTAAPSSKNLVRNPGEEEEESESRQHFIFCNHDLQESRAYWPLGQLR